MGDSETNLPCPPQGAVCASHRSHTPFHPCPLLTIRLYPTEDAVVSKDVVLLRYMEDGNTEQLGSLRLKGDSEPPHTEWPEVEERVRREFAEAQAKAKAKVQRSRRRGKCAREEEVADERARDEYFGEAEGLEAFYSGLGPGFAEGLVGELSALREEMGPRFDVGDGGFGGSE